MEMQLNEMQIRWNLQENFCHSVVICWLGRKYELLRLEVLWMAGLLYSEFAAWNLLLNQQVQSFICHRSL